MFWESFSTGTDLSLQAIDMMQESVVMHVMRTADTITEFREPYAEPYCYGLGCRYKNSCGGVLGTLIISGNHPSTPFEKDIMNLVLMGLDYLQHPRPGFDLLDSAEMGNDSSMLLSRLLRGEDVLRSANLLQVLWHFSSETLFRIVNLSVQGSESDRILERNIQRVLKNKIYTNIDSGKVLLIWETPTEKFRDQEKALCTLAENTSIRIGLSNSFRNPENSVYGKDQAEYALGKTLPGKVSRFEEYGSDYLFSERELRSKRYGRHPAVIQLENYDTKNETNLVRTLKQYLYCERSVRKTAEELFVHKNTVLYRINQIREMCGIDLDDDRERNYLFLSLLLP